MITRLTRNDSRIKRAGIFICLALFAASFMIGIPSIFSTLPVSNATSAGQLSISVAPSLLLANSSFNAEMSVQLLNVNTGTPIDAGAAVQVIVTSNDSAVASAPATTLYIPAGRSYATENLTAGGTAGTALIKASAQGYLSDTFIAVASDAAPTPNNFTTTLTPYFAPGAILSDNSTYPGMVVGELQATNSNGTVYPEIAQSNITVWSRSSDNSTMQVSTAPYIITTGNVYATFNLTSTYFPGGANITLQANGLNPVTTGFTSYSSGISPPTQPTPYFLVQNTIIPSQVLPGGPFTIQVFAKTVNAPISAGGANLTWSSHEANLTGSDSNLNASGYGFATFVAAKQSGLENIQVSIKEDGITPYLDNISVDAYFNNMTATITNQHPSIVTNFPTTITIHATFNNTGLANATITWLTSSGALTSPPSLTNKTGYAIVTYTSGSEAGNFSVQATLSKPGFANATEKVYISVVKPAPVQKVQNPSSNPLYMKVGNLIPLWALIPVVAGGAGAGFFVYKRFRGGGDYYGDDGDEE